MSGKTFEKDRTLAREAGKKGKRGPSRDVRQIREAFHDLLTDNLDKIKEDLQELEPKDRLNFHIRVAEFILPKLQRVESRYDTSNLTEEEANRLVDKIMSYGK